MTNEEKGILGEKYVSKKIKEVIKTLGKDIRLYGPIILKYYSIYGEMTCEIDHIIVLGNTIILGETKNGSYENIDYEASCWTLLNRNDITDNPIVQNHYHKEVFCSEFGLERHNVVTVEFLLNYEECKIRTQNPNDYVLGKDNIDKYLLLLLYFYSDNIEKCDNSKLCEKLQITRILERTSMIRKEKTNNINLKNKKGFIICTGAIVIFLIVIMIVTPIIIHVESKKVCSEITADGLLDYLGNCLAVVPTIILAFVAIWQTNRANKIAEEANQCALESEEIAKNAIKLSEYSIEQTDISNDISRRLLELEENR